MVHEVHLVCDHLYNIKRLWVTNREPPELSQYRFKRVWRTTFTRALLNHAPSSTQLHPPPLSSFQPPPSSLQHPQQYSNQNITRDWVISPNLGWNIQSCPFCLKIDSQGMLEVLIPNPDLDFWNSDPKILFWANLGSKSQSCPFCLEIDTHGISRILILITTLIFWNSNPKIYFWANLGQKSQSCAFCLKIASHGISRMLILIPTIVFWIFNSKFLFGQIWTQKVKVVPIV